MATISPKKRSYSVEDITAALDDMIEGNELLHQNAQAEYGGVGGSSPGETAAQPTRVSISADDALDALGQALKGFPPKPKQDPEYEEEEV